MWKEGERWVDRWIPNSKWLCSRAQCVEASEEQFAGFCRLPPILPEYLSRFRCPLSVWLSSTLSKTRPSSICVVLITARIVQMHGLVPLQRPRSWCMFLFFFVHQVTKTRAMDYTLNICSNDDTDITWTATGTSSGTIYGPYKSYAAHAQERFSSADACLTVVTYNIYGNIFSWELLDASEKSILSHTVLESETKFGKIYNGSVGICPPGTPVAPPSSPAATCAPGCLAGHYLTSTNVCTACPTGQYQTIEDQTACRSDCGSTYQGSYINADQSACVGCSTGRYQDEKDQSSCKSNCEAGYSINSYKTACIACVVGQYQNENQQTECKSCSTGRYQDETQQRIGCKACSSGQ